MNRKRAIPKTVDDYIAGFPPDVRRILSKIRMTIRHAAPGARETISYGIPSWTLNGPLIYFAGFKSHIGLYPMRDTLRRRFNKELSEYLSGKATAKFPLNQPIPYNLIGQIVRFRVKENSVKADRTKTSP